MQVCTLLQPDSEQFLYCTSAHKRPFQCHVLQTYNHTSTPPLSFYRPDAFPAAQPTASKHWRISVLVIIIRRNCCMITCLEWGANELMPLPPQFCFFKVQNSLFFWCWLTHRGPDHSTERGSLGGGHLPAYCTIMGIVRSEPCKCRWTDWDLI